MHKYIDVIMGHIVIENVKKKCLLLVLMIVLLLQDCTIEALLCRSFLRVCSQQVDFPHATLKDQVTLDHHGETPNFPAADFTPLTPLQRIERWEAAVDLLEATIDHRRRLDHRASKARLVGIYTHDYGRHSLSHNSSMLLVAVQPDRSFGRKFIFLDSLGNLVGHMLVETSNKIGESASSALRGMFVGETSRGKGYSKLFLAIWMRLCLEARVVPSTTRINKPLLALTLQRFGFSPIPNTSTLDEKPNKKCLVVQVSVGVGGHVSLYSELFRDQLVAGFTATEMSSQRLVIANEPNELCGKEVHIRTRFEFPTGLKGLEDVTELLLASGFHMCADHDGDNDVPLTVSGRNEVIRALYGRI